jgi:phenylpyruvate tautomerase PptA (4-oxalocrotonate tautomerase family)
MRAGKPPAYRQAILDSLARAMGEALNLPDGNQFMTITEHEAENFRYGASYLGLARSDDLIFVQIAVLDTRPAEQKKALFQRAVERLRESPGLRSEDVFVLVLDAAKENWSLGNGLMQYT